MNRIQRPQSLLAQFSEASSEIQVVNDAGVVKGYLNSPAYRSHFYSWLKTVLLEDDEQAKARVEVGGYTTAEAIAYLRDLEAPYKKNHP